MSENPFSSPATTGHAVPAQPSRKRSIWLWLVPGLILFSLLVGMLLMPVTRSSGRAAKRTMCRSNIKYLAIALHNYEATFGEFPPAYTVDEKGNRLHSWRTLLLPYLENQNLYDSIDLTKPWDDPANQATFNKYVNSHSDRQFRCPSQQLQDGYTTYLAVVTKDSVLRGEKSCSLKQVTDGTANTIMIIEVPAEHAVPWMKPSDADEELLSALVESNPPHNVGFNAALCDTSTRFIGSDKLETEGFAAALTIAGGENTLFLFE